MVPRMSMVRNAAYLCGPPATVDSTAAALVGLGAAPEAIWKEKHDCMPAETYQHGRTMGPEGDSPDLGPQMTVAEAADAMAALLTRAGDRGDDEQW
jgi:ferredoxin-NADP reductase